MEFAPLVIPQSSSYLNIRKRRQAMKRTILTVASLAIMLGSAYAAPRISDDPPAIPTGTTSEHALLRMKKAGWMADPGRCLNAYPNVCEMDFVNKCGAVARATFLNQKLTAVKFI